MSAQAATTGSPWTVYGPTVVTSTRQRAVRPRSAMASVASTVTSSWADPVPSRTASSLARFRPARPIRTVGGAWVAR